MSLDKAAKYLAAHGRGNDSMLVHMSPKEVNSLQTLAKASGGSLTINPHTGLAEAGWLDSLLPIVAGIGLNAMFPGLGSLATAGIVGGGTALATGDIGKGLSAGLGAYGGAGIGQGLTAAGASQAGLDAGAAALNTTPEALSTTQGMTNALTSPSTYEGADQLISHELDPTKIQNFADAYAQGSATPDTFSGRLGQMSQGVGSLTTEGGRAAAYNAMPTGTLTSTGGALLASAPQPEVPKFEEKPSSGKWLSSDFRGYTPPQPNPYYKPTGLGYGGYAQGGEIKSYAFGGTTTATAGTTPRQGFSAGSPSEGGIFSPRFANALTGMDSSGFGNLGFMNKLRNMLHTNDGSTAFGGFKDLSPNFGQGLAQAQALSGAGSRYTPQGLGYAEGGMAMGGMPGQMFPGSAPQSQYATPTQAPASAMTAGNNYETTLDPYSGEPVRMAKGGLPSGGMSIGDGILRDSNDTTAPMDAFEAAKYKQKQLAKRSNLRMAELPKTNVSSLGDIKTGPVGIAAAAGGSIGGYSDGGRMLKGPGDGMSDSIPATIGNKQPARLADGEFVVPADVVSHLGNGSTDAGAKRLYSMMDRVRKARTGNKKQGKEINADKFLPK